MMMLEKHRTWRIEDGLDRRVLRREQKNLAQKYCSALKCSEVHVCLLEIVLASAGQLGVRGEGRK